MTYAGTMKQYRPGAYYAYMDNIPGKPKYFPFKKTQCIPAAAYEALLKSENLGSDIEIKLSKSQDKLETVSLLTRVIIASVITATEKVVLLNIDGKQCQFETPPHGTPFSKLTALSVVSVEVYTLNNKLFTRGRNTFYAKSIELVSKKDRPGRGEVVQTDPLLHVPLENSAIANARYKKILGFVLEQTKKFRTKDALQEAVTKICQESVGMSHEERKYFAEDKSRLSPIQDFIQDFFNNPMHSLKIKQLHQRKLTDLGIDSKEPSCVSFMWVQENGRNVIYVAVSGNGIIEAKPGLYHFLSNFIEHYESGKGPRSAERDVEFKMVDATSTGSRSFHQLIRSVLSEHGLPPAEKPEARCTEKALISTLLKLITIYGGIRKKEDPCREGIRVVGVYNISFYPRHLEGAILKTDLGSKIPARQLGNQNEAIKDKQERYYPLIPCCANCRANKLSIQIIIWAILQLPVQRVKYLFSPIRVPNWSKKSQPEIKEMVLAGVGEDKKEMRAALGPINGVLPLPACMPKTPSRPMRRTTSRD